MYNRAIYGSTRVFAKRRVFVPLAIQREWGLLLNRIHDDTRLHEVLNLTETQTIERNDHA